VGQINSAVSQLNQTTQQNASSSEELAATSEEMSSQAEQLQQTMSFFKLDGAGPAKAPAFTVRKAAAKPGARQGGGPRPAGLTAVARPPASTSRVHQVLKEPAMTALAKAPASRPASQPALPGAAQARSRKSST
jgi:hypothetical protein